MAHADEGSVVQGRTVGIVRFDRSTVEKAKCAIDVHPSWQTHKATMTDLSRRVILRIKHWRTHDSTTRISRLLLQRPSLLHQPRHNRFSLRPWRRLRHSDDGRSSHATSGGGPADACSSHATTDDGATFHGG